MRSSSCTGFFASIRSRRGARVALSSGALALVGALTGAGSARAQALPSFDARTYRPSTDPSASLVYEPVGTPGPWLWNVGAGLGYAHRPIVLRGARTGDETFVPVRNQLALDLVGGLGLGTRGFVGVALPLALAQEGSGNLPSSTSTARRVPTTALGDLAVHGKAALVDNRDGGFGVAALGTMTLPTGNQESFLGEGAVTAQGRLLGSYSFVLAELSGSLGYKLRTAQRVWPDPGGARFGDEIPFTLSLTVRPSVLGLDSANRQRWEMSLHGWVPAGPVAPLGLGDERSPPLSPAMIAISDRVELGRRRDLYVVAGVDLGLGSAIGVPSFRGLAQLGWSPRTHDEDGDGVPDDVDQCRQIPEDRDGFEDSDGCPEIDDDDDGIVDKEDACPRVAGVESSEPRRNGCPVGDRDRDGVPDDVDRCPSLRGVPSSEPGKNGCPLVDSDGDGVTDELDRCPDQKEDRDGFEDDDGCPDPDNDKDGIPDAADMCPQEPGVAKANAARHGCPALDRDHDTFDDEDGDKCLDQPETWNGVADDDGCADVGGRPLLVLDRKAYTLRVASPVAFLAPAPGVAGAHAALDAKTEGALRAIAALLKQHPGWSVGVASRPRAGSSVAAEEAMGRALAIESAIAAHGPPDGAVETVGWDPKLANRFDANTQFVLRISSNALPLAVPPGAGAPPGEVAPSKPAAPKAQ
ncbi:MAG: hypothetical protein IPF92_10990 [Myxococcales bacterium]|jgi:hypothetical protein|nr:hypothetical protein [Myxococcales bacterium]MBL0198396.1 hypothetical protein [Myxococcales bacterium]HQY61753.1 hypothetical protein [Polyangiaceae bacterium]